MVCAIGLDGDRGVNCHAPAWAPRNYQDVLFHKGAFYTVSVDSELNEWVPDGSSAVRRARIVASPRTEPVRDVPVLVESTIRDQLLMVSTPKDDGGGPSLCSQLDVSRYDEHEGRWIPYVNRGDMEILVKDNVGLCVPRRGEPIMSTSSWFYSVDYDSSDSTSYGPYDCSLWRYGN
ncbi:hypothetical protein D1007_25962 [Hordeum vulgare]|nr:hypothetical protein D1007_25962 [Hordeum vulgare]